MKKKISPWWLLPLSLVFASGVAQATSLATLLTPGSSLPAGDKVFGSFGFNTLSGIVDPTLIDVTELIVSDPLGTAIGLQFTPSAPLSVGTGGGDIVFDVTFNISGPINGVIQQYQSAATGTNFASFEFSSFTQIPTLALHQCTGDCLTPTLNSSAISLMNALSVDQQIQINHRQTTGSASVSSWGFFVTPAPVTAPEPATWFVGLALVAFSCIVSFLRRRRTAAK